MSSARTAHRRWRVRLAAAAERDFAAIVRWSAQQFGARQATTYRETLLAALEELTEGPEPPGSRARDDIAPGMRTLHVGRRRRRGRHFILYRAAPENTVEVIRILHDAMDLPRHVPQADQTE